MFESLTLSLAEKYEKIFAQSDYHCERKVSLASPLFRFFSVAFRLKMKMLIRFDGNEKKKNTKNFFDFHFSFAIRSTQFN